MSIAFLFILNIISAIPLTSSGQGQGGIQGANIATISARIASGKDLMLGLNWWYINDEKEGIINELEYVGKKDGL